MSCQRAVYQWTEVVTTQMPHLSKPQATVLALWSLGMVVARSCGLTASRSEACACCICPWPRMPGTPGLYPSVAKMENGRQPRLRNQCSVAALPERSCGAGSSPVGRCGAGLQPNSTYEYYVTSVAGPVESAESNHASATTTDVLPLTIDAVDTDKCTHLTDGSEGVAHLSLTTTPTATSITWSGPGVFSDVHAANPTWHPDGSEPLGLCQLSVTADAGGPGDTETLNMYITDSPILTTRGSGGHWVEWGTIPSFLEANVDGGGTVDGRPFAYYGDAKKVVWFNLFGLW